MKALILLAVIVIVVLVGIFTKDKTFTHRLSLAVDILFATTLWSGYDVTISARAGMAVRAKALSQPYSNFLVFLAYLLNKVQANHVELAIQADVMRCVSALMYLGVTDAGKLEVAGKAPLPVDVVAPSTVVVEVPTPPVPSSAALSPPGA